MARNKIEVQLVGDSRSLERAFAKSGKSGTTWGQKMKSAGKVAGLGIAAGVGLAAIGLKKSVDAAKEAELAQGRMRAQLKASGLSWEKHKDHIDKVIDAQSKLSAFDDEDLADSFTNLVRVTGNVNEALRLNALAADFARAKGIPAAKAGELIGKVAGGNIGILSRYGITLKEGATAQEALAVLQKKFGGQAKAYGDSTAGAQEKFAVALENVQEKIGAKVLPMLTRLAEWGIQFIGWAEKNWPRFQQAVSDAIEKVRPHFQALVDYWNNTLLPTIESIVELAKGFWDRFGDDIKRVFNSVKEIVGLALSQVKAIIELVMAIIRGDWSEAWTKIKEIARNALNLLVAYLRLILTNILNAAKALGMAILNGIADQAKKVPGRVWDMVKQIPAKLKDLQILAWGAARDLGLAIIQGILGGLGNLFDMVKDKIVDGVTGAIDWAKDHLGSTAAEYAAKNLGAPIGQGIADGITGSLAGIQGALQMTGRAAITAPSVSGGASGLPATAARTRSNGSGRMEIALVAVGPDILRELRELERRGRMGGSLA